MKNLICLAILTASSLSVATESEFIRFSDLSDKAQESYDKAYKAQFKIKVSDGSRCTGTYISNKGHGLTAAHCITKCMPALSGPDSLKHWPVDVLVKGKPSKHKVTAYKWSYPQICEAVIDGKLHKIKVLSGPKGRHTEPMPLDVVTYFKYYYFIVQDEVDSYKEKWRDAFYNGWGGGGDFVIFETLDDNKTNKTNCLKISKSDTFKSAHYSLSYPGKASVGSEEVNEDLYLSTGDVFQGNYYSSEVIKIEDQSYRYLNSNLWAYPGSSGASLVNRRDNSISGVLSAVVGREGMSDDELPDARFVSSKVIREQAGDLLGQISCE